LPPASATFQYSFRVSLRLHFLRAEIADLLTGNEVLLEP